MSADLLDVDDSLDSTSLRHLSHQQKIRLTALLDEYLQNLERGIAQDTEQMLAEHPDLVDVFSQYLTKLNAIYGLATHQHSKLAERSDQPLPFHQLGDFELVREIGRGGMGVVYEAKQLSLERPVALKLLSMSSSLDPRQIARFHNESRAAGLLQHPNIVPVYSVGVQQGIHFYAMQLIEGKSIDLWIEQEKAVVELQTESQSGINGRVKWRVIVEWIAQIAEALQVAHEAGIVHRDIKPSNLLLDHTDRIWIADFGLARCTRDTSVTVSGDLVGTVRYMSPEQASGQSALVDAGADIYGIAVTLYEMLTLRPAIEGDDAPSILKRISEHQIRPLRIARPDLPRDLAVVLSKAMSLQRIERYESALAFAEDLRRVLSNLPTIARPATVLERVSSWAVRHQRTVMLTASLFVIALVGLLISFSLVAAQKMQTETIAERNARNEQIAREAVERLGSQMAEKLAEIPAASGLRRQLLEETLGYYQQYAANAQNSPDLRRSLALTLGKIGVLHGELGSQEKSIKALHESEDAFHALTQRDSSDTQAQLEWSVSLNNLGQALHRHGEFNAAKKLFEQAIDLQAGLLGQLDSVESKLESATALSNFALLLADQDAVEKAEAAYRKSIQLLENTNGQHTVETKIQLAAVQTNLSGLIAKVRATEAIELAQRALQIEVAALENEPNSARLSKQTALTLGTLAAAQLEDRQVSAALASYQQAVEVGQQLVDRWPEQPGYRSDLVANLNQLGISFSKLSRAAEAYTVFSQALVHQRKLATQFPSDADVQSTTGSLLNNFAFSCQQLQQPEQALEAFQEAVQFQGEAVRLAPKMKRYSDYLDKHQFNLQAAQSKRK